MTAAAVAWDSAAEPGPLHCGFTTACEVTEDIALPVLGELPAYLDGRLFRNGPGLFEVKHKNGEETQFQHWFDGIATVHRFRVDGSTGTVLYKNRRTMPDLEAAAADAESKAAFRPICFGDQEPCRGVLGKMFQMWRPGAPKRAPMNINVAFDRIAGVGDLIARTDSSQSAVLDIDTLDLKRRLTYGDLNPKFDKPFSGTHSVVDPDTGETFNYCFAIGKSPVKYTVFGTSPDGNHRTLATIDDHPCYLHSLAGTKNYVILIMYPIVANLLKLMTGTPYASSLQFRPDLRAKFYVISRTDDKLAAVYDAPPFFCFHNINAFEDDAGNLQVDLISYENADIISKLYREYLVRQPASFFDRGVATRFTLPDVRNAASTFADNPTSTVEATVRVLADVEIELPCIAPAVQMRPHRFTYGVSSQPGPTMFSSLVKIDLENGTYITWTAPNAACGEPIFVPKPDSDGEDEGVLLSVVLDSAEERSFMVVLDAQSMEEVARATVPQAVPLGFHGRYMTEEFAVAAKS